jgi:hypothetical protein
VVSGKSSGRRREPSEIAESCCTISLQFQLLMFVTALSEQIHALIHFFKLILTDYLERGKVEANSGSVLPLEVPSSFLNIVDYFSRASSKLSKRISDILASPTGTMERASLMLGYRRNFFQKGASLRVEVRPEQ